MTKKIDLSKTVFELTKEYPELIDIMVSLGFTEISKKPMLHSVGKLTTIPKGAKMKKIPMTDIVFTLMNNGFELEGKMPMLDIKDSKEKAEETKPISEPSRTGENNEQISEPSRTGENNDQISKVSSINNSYRENSQERKEQLKSYLRRLGEGEELEKVRKDFVENFSDVDASEIMEAEQELLKEGTALEEVQKLCDVHSALFHGSTFEEKNIKGQAKAIHDITDKLKADNDTLAVSLANLKGHPLNILTRENEVMTSLINDYRVLKDQAKNKEIEKLFAKMREISIHYAKKGDLLYPHLKVAFEISGPADVMWTVDDEIRDELSRLFKENKDDKEWIEELDKVLNRAEEMIYKEQNILFPICARNFSKEDWFNIYQDFKDYEICLGVDNELWEEAETNKLREKKSLEAQPNKLRKSESLKDEIVMPGGHLKLDQLTAMLNTVPLEITFVDADNINRYFNEGPKIFKRPAMAIDRDVFSQHPPKIQPMVRSIIEDFRSGERDKVEVWMQKGGRTMLVTYMAVRDNDKKYLGTMEIVQDMEFAKEYFQG